MSGQAEPMHPEIGSGLQTQPSGIRIAAVDKTKGRGELDTRVAGEQLIALGSDGIHFHVKSELAFLRHSRRGDEARLSGGGGRAAEEADEAGNVCRDSGAAAHVHW
jgi:hypothetical protein